MRRDAHIGTASLVLFLMLLSGCGESPTKPDDGATLAISSVRNIVWTLDSHEIGGQPVDLSAYEPFHLVYDEDSFGGDDGCNWFGGTYETVVDSVFPGDWSITEMYCSTIQEFPIVHLTKPYRYRIEIDSKELVVYATDSVYTYKSNFVNDMDTLLLGNDWLLRSSSDPEFQEVLGQNSLITLAFDEDRGFEAKWYCGTGDYGCGHVGGLFEIGDSNTVLFYGTRSGGSGAKWYEYLYRILSSSSYHVEDSSLILFSHIDSTGFEFSPWHGLVAQTDKSVYSPGEQIRIRISNYGNSTAFFGHCGNRIIYVFQKREDDWVDYVGWGMPCLAIYLMGDIPIYPDSSYSETVSGFQTGNYRLLFPFNRDSEPIGSDSLFSNEFSVQ